MNLPPAAPVQLEPGASIPSGSAPLDRITGEAGEAIYSLDLEGRVLTWNEGAERLFGYAAGEMLGRDLSVLNPESDGGEEKLRIGRMGQDGLVETVEAVRRTGEGRRIDVAITISPVRDGAGRLVAVSHRVRATGGRTDERKWRMLSELGRALSGELDAEQVLRELARCLVPEFADYAVTYLLHEGEILRIGAAHADPALQSRLDRLAALSPPTLADGAGAGAVIRTGTAILAPTISPAMLAESPGAGNEEYLRILQELGPLSTIVLPLRARDRTLGAVALVTTATSNRHYSADDLPLAQEVADRAALGLSNARLYGEAQAQIELRRAAEAALRRQYDQLRVLYDLTESVGRSTALEEIYEQALRALRTTIGVDRASILLFDPDGVMRFKASFGISATYREAVEGHSPWSRDTIDPEPISIADVERDPDLGSELRRAILDEGIRAMSFIPLVFGPRLLGKFMLYFDRPHHFLEEEVELARSVAGTIAFAITRVNDALSIRQAKEEAESANSAKSQFLGVMSHELRTPLNAIAGYVDLIELGIHGPVTPEQREALGRITANQRHLLRLINDILSFARLEAGHVEYEIETVPLRRTLAAMDALVEPLAAARGTKYSVVESPGEILVRGDEERLRQILLNLISNAVKFTPPGGSIRVDCGVDDGWGFIRVEDDGPGIAPENHTSIFDPFVQVDKHLHQRRDGAGLGLAISRELARGMGGEILLESYPGRGSRFTLRLPLAGPGSAELGEGAGVIGPTFPLPSG